MLDLLDFCFFQIRALILHCTKSRSRAATIIMEKVNLAELLMGIQMAIGIKNLSLIRQIINLGGNLHWLNAPPCTTLRYTLSETFEFEPYNEKNDNNIKQ